MLLNNNKTETPYFHYRNVLELTLSNSKEINKHKNILIDMFETITGINRKIFASHITSGKFDLLMNQALSDKDILADKHNPNYLYVQEKETPSRYQLEKYLGICDEWFAIAKEKGMAY